MVIKKGTNTAPNRILLIEDNPAIVEMVRRELQAVNANTEIRHAQSPAEGKAALEEGAKYALIICTDEFAGHESGLELWRDWERLQEHTPFVLFSGADRETVHKLLGWGEISPFFVRKPIQPAACRELLALYIPAAAAA